MKFYKYHGTGNDFILLDQRFGQSLNEQDAETIAALCQRRFGIGADGLILLQKSDEADFHMAYFNADGRPSSMCGNGGRCVVAFAKRLSVFEGSECRFTASDGLHRAKLLPDGRIALKMGDVPLVRKFGEDFFLDTGSPHYVCFVQEPDAVDVRAEGARIRYSDAWRSEGVNVNFVATKGEQLRVRTYERGVEAETRSCGTGVTAAALAFWYKTSPLAGTHTQAISTPGGELEVRFTFEPSVGFRQIWLVGPAVPVFEGKWSGKQARPEEAL